MTQFLRTVFGILVLGMFSFIFSENSYAACTGTTRQWQGTDGTSWAANTANWSTGVIPVATTDDVLIVATNVVPNTSYSIGCMDILSGGLRDAGTSLNITISGEHFSAPYQNTINPKAGSTTSRISFIMAGQIPQTFEAVDTVKAVTITNTTSVTFKNDFTITSAITLPTSGTTYVEGTLRLTGALSIPTGHTFIIKSGAAVYAAGGVTVNGTLQIDGGGELRLSSTTTLNVGTGTTTAGLLKVIGSPGNPARILSEYSSVYFTMVVNNLGQLSTNYAVISRATRAATGINILGTILQMNNTDIRAHRVSGTANRALITLQPTAIVPAVLDTVGFYNDDGFTPTLAKNIDASLYSLSPIQITNPSGDISGANNEIDNNTAGTAPDYMISWGTSAPTLLQIVNDSESADLGTTITANSTKIFGEFAFVLSQPDGISREISQVTVAMIGSATMADLASVKAYIDAGSPATKDCDYIAGDTQVNGGQNLVFSGSPPRATVSLSTGQLIASTTNMNYACLHIVATTTATPSDQKTLQFAILSASDVVTSPHIDISDTSGTPMYGRYTMINNSANADAVWRGSSGNGLWSTPANWSTNAFPPGPTGRKNCQIGKGTLDTISNAASMYCATANLTTGGAINFNSTTNTLDITGGLIVSSGYTFSNADLANIAMTGTSNQTLSLGSAFPGNLIINNTGATNNNQVDLDQSATINGNLTCTQGVLNIGSGITLTVLKAINIGNLCSININAGGTLVMANGQTLTVNSGGTLQAVGSAGLKATITSNVINASYNIIINNSATIKAQNYVFDHLGLDGLLIDTSATIDSTYHLQDGTFSYPVGNGAKMLRLKRQVPGNSITNLAFETNTSTATNIINIETDPAIAAGATLEITGYLGDVGGVGDSTFNTSIFTESAPVYLLHWSGQINSLEVAGDAIGLATAAGGDLAVNVGRFRIKQKQASISFSDTYISSLKLTLTGTGSANDVALAEVYSDPGCTGTGGTLIGSGTFTGNPASKTFTLGSTDLVVPASTTKVCFYVEFDISATATNGNTVGVKITSATDIVNSQNYIISSSTVYPVSPSTTTISIPTTTTWTGTTNTTWATKTNWSNGVPSAIVDCEIPTTTNKPNITTTTATCKNLLLAGTGAFTIATGGILNVYGDYTSTSTAATPVTLTGTGKILIQNLNYNNHYISSTATIPGMNFAANGFVYINDTATTITTLGTLSSTTKLTIPTGKKLILPSGYTLSAGTLRIEGGGTLELGNASTLSITGGTFQIAGTNEIFPQTLVTKGVVQVTGNGTNSYSVNTTGGVLDLTGFNFDRIGVTGLNIGGTTTVTHIDGGQFTNLSATYASVKALQINTTGTIPAAATNIAWTWGAFNTFTSTANTPTSSQTYKLLSSTGCASHAIDFTGWDGDWFSSQPTFDVSTKVSTVATCTMTFSASASAVSIRSFSAIPYDAKVDVRWETNLERDHLGFNIYRTTDGATRFVQVNKELIRNLKTSSSNHGSYRYIDVDVNNVQNYYYYLEEVDIYGKTKLYGPVFAAPLLGLDSPPAAGISDNAGTNSSTAGGPVYTPPVIANPSYQDLGNGIVIVSQTNSSLRIEITPPTPSFTANGSYENIIMAGYSKMTSVGKPELPEKDILIEVQRFATTAAVNNVAITSNILTNHLVTPAPTYTLNGSGVLVPSYVPNTTTYSTSAFYPVQTYPTEFYGIETNLISMNDKKFLKLKVNPMRTNPVTREINSASKITLDIGLDGDDWNVSIPNVSSNLTPYSVASTLRIDIKNNGIHQVSYSDLVNSQVEAPFSNTDTSLWRLYYKNNEIPLEIHSATGNFASGDYIRFYAPYEPSLESLKNQYILSPINLTNTTSAPKRMGLVDANPIGAIDATDILQTFSKVLEDNSIYFDVYALGDVFDHFFYADLKSGGADDTFTATTALPEIDVNNPGDVLIKFYVKGSVGQFQIPVKHHVKLFVADNELGEAIFDEQGRTVISFLVGASDFNQTSNKIDLKLLSTFTVGDYDRLLVDKVEIVYKGKQAKSLSATASIASFSIADQLVNYSIDGFKSNIISGYDISAPLNPKKLYNLLISTPDSGATYSAKFFIDDKQDDNGNKVYSFFSDAPYVKPISLSLNPGANTSLKNSSNEADLIILGDENLLVAAADLITMRTAQGLIVKTVTPEEVYSEFSYGVTSTQAIRDFISTARSNWNRSPRYLLILGDGTNDPLDNVSTTDKATLPAPIIPGRFIDFSSDNYFVSTASSHLPTISVGRIPTNNPDKIKAYIEKIRKYEAGEATPTTNVKKISFFADKDTFDNGGKNNFEHFNLMSQNMMSAASGFTNVLYDRVELGSLNATKVKINSEFNLGPLMISLAGHGAFDQFGEEIFKIADAQNLANNTYPIVAVWNCETATFYNYNTTYVTLGEELIFNPNGGAIAFLGSTAQTTPPAQSHLAQNFFSQLSSVSQKPWDGTRLGDILLQAKIGTGSGTYEQDIVNSFSIIGDPSLKLPANMFQSNQYATEAAAPPKAKGIFGCSAGAADGTDATPWHEGLIEWLIYMALIVFGVKRIALKPTKLI